MDVADSWYLKEKQRTWKTKLDTINARLLTSTKESISDGIVEAKIQHGLQIITSTKLFEEYLDICYCDDVQEYMILDSTLKIYKYSIQGRFIQPSYNLTSSMVFTKILWCSGIKLLIGYIPNDDLIWILTPECKLLQTIRNDFKINNVFYSSASKELIVMCFTSLMKYSLSSLDKSLMPHDAINFMDQTYGSLWGIQYSSFISMDTSFRVVGSYLTTIYIISGDHREDEDVGAPVEFLARKSKASVSVITALHFDLMSQWIIVGDQQGNVLGWTLTLENVFKYSQGLKGAVRTIVSHPSLCGFITSSEDNILQVWSCNLREKMESFSELGVISSIAVSKMTSSIAAIGDKLSFFRIHQLYVFFTPLTASAEILFSTKNYAHPTRIIVCSSDGVISMLSPAGKQLSMMLFPLEFNSSSIAYSAITGNVYLISAESTQIFVNNTATTPMELRYAWSSEKKITYITVYDYFEEINNSDRKCADNKVVHPHCARIIIGTNTGELISLEETTGKYEHTIKAHEASIIKIHSSTVSKRIFSMGMDRCLKIWKILPFIKTFLVLIDYVYYTIPIADLDSMGFTVCLVSIAEHVAMHQLIMYDTNEKINLYHPESHNHNKKIIGIATSETLLICATSSADYTIRIWDTQNSLLKILEVNVCVQKITFSSLRGDIVFSVGKHLYRLPFNNYLSPKYRNIIKINNIPEDIEEDAMPRHDDYHVYEKDEFKKQALYPVSSVPLGSLDPSSDVPRLDLVIQQQMCMQLKFRDEDILKIEESNTNREKKLSKRRASMSSDEWEKYMNNLLGLSSKNIEVIPPHNIWAIKEEYSNIKKVPNKTKIIPNYFDDYLEYYNTESFIGFIPNSLIVKIPDEKNSKEFFIEWVLEGFNELLELRNSSEYL
ncbi:uncharacterized protein [Chelonus insularis]|uniref:uncharacterized protein n=1 Tax=Chelonus insularis TaxID=460826 RepID=UPI00158C0266|nr:uncharacterized protein LOC118063864 [Chelonus insularis]